MFPSCPFVRSMSEIVQSGKPFLWLPDKMPIFLADSDAIQYSLDASKVYEAHKVEDHIPIFREHIQIQSSESSRLIFPAKKLMADAKGYKSSPSITMDSTLYDLMMDIGVPNNTAAGSRDPDPEAPVPAAKARPPTPAKIPATVPKAPAPSAKAPTSKSVAKAKSVAEPEEPLAPVEMIEEDADDEIEEEEPLNRE